jgi:two-component system NtrC family sensor kinase
MIARAERSDPARGLRVDLAAARAEVRSLHEAQAAITHILELVNRARTDARPVLDAIIAHALRLCDGPFADVFLSDGTLVHLAAHNFAVAGSAEADVLVGAYPQPLDGMSLPAKVIRAGKVVQFADVETNPNATDLTRRHARLIGYRSGIMIPMMRDGVAVGAIGVARAEPGEFPDQLVRVLQTFADQAAISVENARLFNELSEALEQQTATADLMRVVSGSNFELQPVLDALIRSAARLCGAENAFVFLLNDGLFRLASVHAFSPEFVEYQAQMGRLAIPPGRGTLVGRTALEAKMVHIPDVLADREYQWPSSQQQAGYRSMLGIPLLRGGSAIGVIALTRRRAEPFTPSEITLVSTFADQAVIAIENARLITETRRARDTAETALKELKAAQASLVQAQKMAALGQLTAGIAHEIKNPLNFVNNFASLSVELLDELKASAAPALAALDADARAEIDETVEMLTGNLEKIGEHGRRADGIVRSMLEHSRGASGERRSVDLNALVEEALNLAYHGARAQDANFNITLERDYEPGLKPIELAPQEMSRVFLNLFGNGFYAANKRMRDNGDETFRPVLAVRTREDGDGDAVEVRVRDNGIGIPPDIRDKLFQPFFTTKPTGEGTGLGLSISYDIVTQQHGGSITVESEPGSYTEFTIRLPRQ